MSTEIVPCGAESLSHRVVRVFDDGSRCVKPHYSPAPLRVFLRLTSSKEREAPRVFPAGVPRGEAVLCRTERRVVTSPADSVLDTELPRSRSLPITLATPPPRLCCCCFVVSNLLSLWTRFVTKLWVPPCNCPLLWLAL